jgi:hypothetical protein
MDFVSLSQPPLHIVPLFYEQPSDKKPFDQAGLYEVPHWINLQFVNIEQSVEKISPPSRTSTQASSRNATGSASTKPKVSESLKKGGERRGMVYKKGTTGATTTNEKSPSYKKTKDSTVDNVGEGNDINTGSSVPLYTTESFSFSPFPFGEVLQRHADNLSSVDSLVHASNNPSSGLDAPMVAATDPTRSASAAGVPGGVLGCNHRTAIILRLLSLPRALEKYLIMSQCNESTCNASSAVPRDANSEVIGRHIDSKARGVWTTSTASMATPNSPKARALNMRCRGGTVGDLGALTGRQEGKDTSPNDDDTNTTTTIHLLDSKAAQNSAAELPSTPTPIPTPSPVPSSASTTSESGPGVSSSHHVSSSEAPAPPPVSLWGEVKFSARTVAVSEGWKASRIRAAEESEACSESGKSGAFSLIYIRVRVCSVHSTNINISHLFHVYPCVNRGDSS